MSCKFLERSDECEPYEIVARKSKNLSKIIVSDNSPHLFWHKTGSLMFIRIRQF